MDSPSTSSFQCFSWAIRSLDGSRNFLYAVFTMLAARGEKKKLGLTADFVGILSRGIGTTPV